MAYTYNKLYYFHIANTYNTFHSLPPQILRDNSSAVILPVFFLKNRDGFLKNCNSLIECAELLSIWE